MEMESVPGHNEMNELLRKVSGKLNASGESTGFCFSCCKYLKKPQQCSKCKVAKYCGAECQREDWGRHKKYCGLPELDIQSFNSKAFDPIFDRIEGKLEGLTDGGKVVGVIRVTAKTIVTNDNLIKLNLRRGKNSWVNLYPNGFVEGTYWVEANRGLLIGLIKAIRTVLPNGKIKWYFEMNSKSLVDNLKTNVVIAEALQGCPPLLRQFKNGDFQSNLFSSDGLLTNIVEKI